MNALYIVNGEHGISYIFPDNAFLTIPVFQLKQCSETLISSRHL